MKKQLKIAVITAIIGIGVLSGCGKKENNHSNGSNTGGNGVGSNTTASPSATAIPNAPATAMPKNGTQVPPSTTNTPAAPSS